MRFSLAILILLISLCLVPLIFAAQDYYKLLGVKRDASEQDLKRAFKKLSLKYHPDKNRGNAEDAKNKFAEIVNAYETLRDPEQRQAYDAKGEEGVRQQQAQKAQQEQFQQGGGFPGGGFRFQSGGGNFEDMFSNFFGGGGGGGGGGGFHFNFGGGGQQQQQQQKNENFFDNSDVYEINLGSLSKFYRRTDVWIIFFYKPDQQESKDIKDKWRELAEKYFGIFKVAAVNCKEDQELCEDEFAIFETPRVLAYTSALNHDGVLFKGDMKNTQLLANFAVSFMESYVRLLNKDNFQEFVESEPERHKVLLFTAKKATPPLFKALSKDLKGKMLFGEIRENDFNKELITRFSIKNIPSLMVLTDPTKAMGVFYEGTYKKDAIMRFLREYAYSTVKKPSKADKGMVVEMTRAFLKESNKCGGQDPNLCFLLISSNKAHDKLEMIKGLAHIYEEDPIHFGFIDGNEIDLKELLDVDDISLPSLIIIKGKKMRWTRYESDDFELEKIRGFIDQTLGGSANFKKMKVSLEEALKEEATKGEL